MKTINSTLITTGVFSDDMQHRFLLRKEWDDSLPSAAIIMIFPGSDNLNDTDLTTTLVLNNAAKLGYGSVSIVNLFSKINANTGVREVSAINDFDNDGQILEAVKSADTVIVAWGTGGEGNKKFRRRQLEVAKLLEPYENKVMTTFDPATKKQSIHPLTPSIRSHWSLEKFTFPVAEEKPTVKSFDVLGQEPSKSKSTKRGQKKQPVEMPEEAQAGASEPFEQASDEVSATM